MFDDSVWMDSHIHCEKADFLYIYFQKTLVQLNWVKMVNLTTFYIVN